MTNYTNGGNIQQNISLSLLRQKRPKDEDYLVFGLIVSQGKFPNNTESVSYLKKVFFLKQVLEKQACLLIKVVL